MQFTKSILKKIFVTGTDTNIGKTLISSWLCLHSGFDYFKPIQTGASILQDKDYVTKLSNVYCHNEIYKSKLPLSPHLAFNKQIHTISNLHNVEDANNTYLNSRLSKINNIQTSNSNCDSDSDYILDLDNVAKQILSQISSRHSTMTPNKLSSTHELHNLNDNNKINGTIIEGVGGVFVPINESDMIIDIIVRLKMPTIIVAKSCVGTINHTLLTIEALRNRDVEILGVILNCCWNNNCINCVNHHNINYKSYNYCTDYKNDNYINNRIDNNIKNQINRSNEIGDISDNEIVGYNKSNSSKSQFSINIPQMNADAIAFYGKVKILSIFPRLQNINREILSKVKFTSELKKLFE